MRPRVVSVVTGLLLLGAAARILLAVAAMPPYAGLDEAWHVARVAFVAREHRQPSAAERSIPPYIGDSIRGTHMPAFGEMRARWPDVVRAQRPVVDERPLTTRDLAPYESANYEAQQPALYYAIAAPFAGGSAAGELRRLRLLSALFALVVIAAAMSLAHRWFGVRGAVAAVLIASLPTWITLVVRASNDALACALAAAAIAVTASSPRGWRVAVEALVWALAIASKLYVWPIAIVVPILWRAQRGTRARLALVAIACAIAALATVHDLSTRTSNPLGDAGFNPPVQHQSPQPIDFAAMGKITVASAIWMSGQHGDALRPLAMLLYVVPLIALARVRRGPWLMAATAALLAFAVAQAVHALGFIHAARAAGLVLPLGGKEGWYWYALAPLLIGVFALRIRLAAVWVVAWDVFITEGALFHDFAGATSPLHRSAFFTWGPLHAPFTAALTGIAVGPLATHVVALRVIHLVALTSALCVLPSAFQLESLLQESSTDDRHARR
jgi:hypothetical protein